MKYIAGNKKHFTLTNKTIIFAITLTFFQISAAKAEFVPDGYFLLPNGTLMAENPKTAEAPEGYDLNPDGTLLKINLDLSLTEQNTVTHSTQQKNKPHTNIIPPGFHLMEDGTFMADDPKTAKIPPEYHLMSDGTLMSAHGGGNHHSKGMWMADYLYTQMDLKNLIDGSKKITAQNATTPSNLYNYMMSPSDMSMKMHTGILMYGVSNKLLARIMVRYMKNNMNILSSDGTKSTIKTSGFGDTVISGLFKGPYNLNFSLGLSIPTGSINERGPMTHSASYTQADVKYSYGMQLGSGSYELKQGVEYSDALKSISWGANYELTARLNENKVAYKLGNLLKLEGWAQWDMLSLLSIKTNMTFYSQGKITGSDKNIDDNIITMSPSYNSINYGGNRIDVGGSAIIRIPNNNYSIVANFSVPIRQTLWGPQIAVSSIVSIGFSNMW